MIEHDRESDPTTNDNTIFVQVLGILNNAIDMRKPKYGKSCLGNTMLKLAEHSDFKNVPDRLDEYSSCRTTDYYYSMYLGHLNQDRKYFLETLKSSRVISGGPYRQQIRNNMQCVVDASNVASVSATVLCPYITRRLQKQYKLQLKQFYVLHSVHVVREVP